MQHLAPHTTGLIFGIVFGGLHLVWSALVAFGLAQPIADFVFWAHMIAPIHVVAPFSMVAAVVLVALSSAVGYVVGYAGASVANRVHSAQGM